MAKILLSNGVDANRIRPTITGDAETPLLAAIRNNHSHVADLLLNGRASPDVGDCYGVLALDLATVQEW